MDVNLLATIKDLHLEIKKLEEKIHHLEQKMEKNERNYKANLIRLINDYPISDDMVRANIPYLDLSPEDAFKLYKDPKYRFLILDVSSKNFDPPTKIKGRIHIPFEDLSQKAEELEGVVAPIMIISENGTDSIRACHLLAAKGFLYLNNISGGHAFWPGHLK